MTRVLEYREAPAIEGDFPAPAPALAGSMKVLAQLRGTTGPVEVHLPARGALGWATALAVRQSGDLPDVRVVVEVAPGDESLASMPPEGAPLADFLVLQAARCALRDADAVEGDAAVIQRLRDAGLQLATAREPPAWEQPPGVSAVVTHKDLGRYLRACIDSLQKQTVPVEIVLVDDGSGPDGLASVAEEERRDPSLRVVRQANRGLGGARNAGVEAASGAFVLIVDADNVMRPALVERLLEALRRRPWADFAVPAFRAFDDDTNAQLYLYCPSEAWAPTLLADNTGGDACALHRREALLAVGGFDAQFNPAEDWALWARYVESGHSGIVVPEVLFDYRVRKDSMMRAARQTRVLSTPFRIALRHPALLEKHLETTLSLWGSRIAELNALARHEARKGAIEELQPHVDALRAEVQAARQRERAALEAVARAEASERNAAAEWARTAESVREALADRDRHAADAARLREELAALRLSFEELANSTPVRTARRLQSLSPRLYRLAGVLAGRRK